MAEKKVIVRMPEKDSVIQHQHLCLENNIATILKHSGKRYAMPLCDGFDFSYKSCGTGKIADGLEFKRDLSDFYVKYGLCLNKKPVTDFKDYCSVLRGCIDKKMPVIVHFDCYYLDYDPFYKTIHNNHSLLVTGYSDDGFYITDPFFGKEKFVESDTLKLASKFYYEIEGKADFTALSYLERFNLKCAELKTCGYFNSLRKLADDIKCLRAENEFSDLSDFDKFYDSDLMRAIIKIITNKYRFYLFLAEWKPLYGEKFKSVLSAWQTFKVLMVKTFYLKFSKLSLTRAAEQILKISEAEQSFLSATYCFSENKSKAADLARLSGEALNIVEYCNNKGLVLKHGKTRADCSGVGEYICVENVESEIEKLGYKLLADKPKDNIVCKGQNVILPKMRDIRGLKLLVAAEWGDYYAEFKINYKNSAEEFLTVFITDWGYAGKGRVSLGATYKKQNGRFKFFRDSTYAEEIYIPLHEGYESIVLPDCSNLHVFSVVLLKDKNKEDKED